MRIYFGNYAYVFSITEVPFNTKLDSDYYWRESQRATPIQGQFVREYNFVAIQNTPFKVGQKLSLIFYEEPTQAMTSGVSGGTLVAHHFNLPSTVNSSATF